MDPLVSIVIPVYNGSNYLQEAIESALAQTYSNVEILVVNDGSNDGGATRNIARSYGDKIRYFEKANGGVSTALNYGIKNMRGKYFSWLSHDDLYYPDKIQAQIDALREAGDMFRISYSNWSSMSMPSREIAEYNGTRQYRKEFLETGAFAAVFGFTSGCTLFIPKIYFDAYGGFDETFLAVQDYKKWFEICRGKRLVYVPKSLVIARHHSEQASYRYKMMKTEDLWLHHWMFYNVDENDLVGSGLTDMYHFYSAVFSRWRHSSYTEGVNFVYEKLKELPESPDVDDRIVRFADFLMDNRYDTYYLKENEIVIKQELQLRGMNFNDNSRFIPANQISDLKSSKPIRVFDFMLLIQWLIDTPIKKAMLNRLEWLKAR